MSRESESTYQPVQSVEDCESVLLEKAVDLWHEEAASEPSGEYVDDLHGRIFDRLLEWWDRVGSIDAGLTLPSELIVKLLESAVEEACEQMEEHLPSWVFPRL